MSDDTPQLRPADSAERNYVVMQKPPAQAPSIGFPTNTHLTD